MLNNHFSELRILAAILVMWGHLFVLNGLPAPMLFGLPVHALAVKCFFVISGYLIAQSLHSDPNLLRYLLKRFFRIYPAFFSCIVITVMVCSVFDQRSVQEFFFNSSSSRYWFNLLLYPVYRIPGIFTENKLPAVNGSLWSIPVEVFAYLSLAAMFFLARSRYVIMMFLLLISTLFCVHYSVVNDVSDEHVVIWGNSVLFSTRVLQYFLVGSIFFFLRLQRFLDLRIALIILGMLSIMEGWVRDVFRVLAVSYVILAIALRVHGMKLPVHFQTNDYSYGIYLYAFPVQQLFVTTSLSVSLQFFVSFVCVLFLAFLSWHVVEKNALKLKPGKRAVSDKDKEFPKEVVLEDR